MNLCLARKDDLLEVGRPAGVKQGTAFNVPFAVNLEPMRLPADQTFEWKLKVEGQGEWQVAFATRPIA